MDGILAWTHKDPCPLPFKRLTWRGSASRILPPGCPLAWYAASGPSPGGLQDWSSGIESLQEEPGSQCQEMGRKVALEKGLLLISAAGWQWGAQEHSSLDQPLKEWMNERGRGRRRRSG